MNHAAFLPRLLAVGATALTVGGCAVLGDDPKRTFSLPNNTGDPRLVRRCDDEFDCRSPGERELVRPGGSLNFKLYMDEDRTFVVGDAHGVTLGCLMMPLADGTDPPTTLSDLQQCPPDTPKEYGALDRRDPADSYVIRLGDVEAVYSAGSRPATWNVEGSGLPFLPWPPSSWPDYAGPPEPGWPEYFE